MSLHFIIRHPILMAIIVKVMIVGLLLACPEVCGGVAERSLGEC
jgi:hypothetical protein